MFLQMGGFLMQNMSLDLKCVDGYEFVNFKI